MVRVLVIDDEPDVLLLCRLNLRHAGHEVIEAASGELGIELAKETVPDVVVLDLMLPEMDGYQVMEALSGDERTRDVPVLVLSAKVQDEDRTRCWRMGADGFIPKPFAPDELAETVERLAITPRDQRARQRADVLRDLSEA